MSTLSSGTHRSQGDSKTIIDAGGGGDLCMTLCFTNVEAQGMLFP